jgi:peptide deformylase
MAIKTVLRMGDPLLLQKAKPVEAFDTPEIHGLIEDMQDTMAHMNGAGIAAPQIGVSMRVVIFGQPDDRREVNPRYPDADHVPYTVLINPTLYFLNNEMEDGWEGCLSVPGLRGVVPRHLHLRYTGYDPQGNLIDRTVSGFHARVVQHECDHLDGILYPMRIKDLSNFGYVDVLFPHQDIQDD